MGSEGNQKRDIPDESEKKENNLDLSSRVQSPLALEDSEIEWDIPSLSSESSVVSPIDIKTQCYNPTYENNLEVAIEKQRIAFVLDRTISRLELVMCLPLLIENGGLMLKSYFTPSEIDAIVSCASKYNNRTTSNILGRRKEPQVSIKNVFAGGVESVRTSLSSPISLNEFRRKHMEKSRDSRSNSTLGEGREDPDMCKTIELICSKPRLVNHIRSELLREISRAASVFLDYAREMRDAALYRLSISPRAKNAMNKKLRTLWLSNERLKSELNQLRTVTNNMINETNSELAAKDRIIKEHEEKIEAMHNQYREKQQKRIYSSERSMLLSWKNSEYRQANLQIETNDAEWTLGNVKERHELHEQELRTKKFKTHSQLVAIINNYDNAMSERQKEYDEISAKFEEESKQMDILQEEFNLQEETYLDIMEEREREEQKQYQERMYMFILNRSARRIQRYWRAYRLRRTTKRRSRWGREIGKGKKPRKKK